MLCVPLENIGKTCGRNIAGVAKIQLIELADIISVPRPQDGVMTGNIVVKSANSFVTWTPDMLSVFSEERKSHSTKKDYYEPSLLVSFSRDRALLIKHHTIMAGKKYAVIVTDRNGVKRFVKVMQNLSKSSTGDFKGKNYYEFRFFNQLPTASSILIGDIVLEELYIEGGLQFDGLTHHVNIPYKTELDPCESIKPFTLFLDFYQTGGEKIVHTQNSSFEDYFGFYINSYSNLLEAVIYNQVSGVSTGVSFAYPTWNRRIKIAVILNTAVMEWSLYIDGDFKKTEPYSTIPSRISSAWQLGGYFRDMILQPYQGVIFDFQYFNRALSLSEVQDLTAANNISLGKVAHYKLDENNGFVASDSVGTNNGTLVNYTLSQVSLGVDNHWVDNDRNPKT